MIKTAKKWIMALLSITLVLALCTAPTAALADDAMTYKGKARIGAQRVNEAIILARMAELLLKEHSGLKTDVYAEFAASSVVHQAMEAGELDIYVSWTGTQLTGPLRYEGPNLSTEETFRLVKEGFEKHFGYTWARPLGFNNTYAMTVRRETAEKYNLKKASDLAPHAAEWRLGGDNTFDSRTDAYPGWSEHYGITFKEVLPMEYSVMYRAITGKQVDVIAAYSTDSRIPKLDLVMLEDDKGWFPDYSAGYVIDMKFLEKFPKVLEILEKVSDTIDEKTMAKMNSRFDDGEEAKDIARDFLLGIGLLSK